MAKTLSLFAVITAAFVISAHVLAVPPAFAFIGGLLIAPASFFIALRSGWID